MRRVSAFTTLSLPASPLASAVHATKRLPMMENSITTMNILMSSMHGLIEVWFGL